MMQARGSKFCQPSGMLVCDANGNLVMTNNGVQNVVEGYQRRTRRRPVRQMRRRRAGKERFHHVYEMKGCPHCVSSKNALQSQIDSGEVVVKDAKEAPQGVRGFPHFESLKTGKSHSGAVKSMAQLNEALGH
jgi:glutaredoxin